MRLKPVDVAAALQEHRANGTFILKTNRLELNCVQVYYLYKTRQDIEQAFKFYDNTLDASASYMRSHQSFEGWLFINHLALQMLYSVPGKVMDKEMVRQVFLRRRHGLPEARESEPDGGHMEDHQDHKEHRKGGKGTWHGTGRPGKPSGHPKMKVTAWFITLRRRGLCQPDSALSTLWWGKGVSLLSQ